MNIMSMATFLQHLANGISLGSLYALVAIGYTLVYGILRLINFAHGDVFMVGGYLAFYGISLVAMPWYVAFAVAVVLTGLLGTLLEAGAYRPLRDAPKISVMISAIGASFLLENVAVVVFGGRPKPFPTPAVLTNMVQIGNVSIQNLTFVIPIVTFLLLAGLLYLINKTRVGMAMRAVSKDHETAAIMGINANHIISLTFFIGSMMAAVGGIMWGLKFPQLTPLMGVIPGLKAFIAAVIGGIGDIRGAVIGGFILGIGEIMLVAFWPELSGYRDAFAFALLILILWFRPTGILGEITAEKV